MIESTVGSFVIGFLLGALYFGSLLWIVQRHVTHRRSDVWLVVSFFVRAALVMIAFAVVLQGGWASAVPCLVGFMLSRTAIIRCVQPAAKPDSRSAGPSNLGRRIETDRTTN